MISSPSPIDEANKVLEFASALIGLYPQLKKVFVIIACFLAMGTKPMTCAIECPATPVLSVAESSRTFSVARIDCVGRNYAE